MITDNQMNLAINKSYNKLLKHGSVPHPYNVMSDAMSRFEGIPKSFPTVPFVILGKKSSFNRSKFNDFISNVGFDLEVAYTSLIDSYKESTKSIISRALETSYLMSRLDDVKKEVYSLKDSINSNTYSKVFLNSFDKNNMINRSLTTSDIDSDFGIITLKSNKSNTNRIGMSHLYRVFSPNLRLSDIPPTSVLKNAPVPNHGFDNALIDNGNSWIQSIILEGYSGPITASLDIPLTKSDYSTTSISRVDIKPKRNNTSEIELFVSKDGENFSLFGEKLQSENKGVVFHGSKNARILRVVFKKPSYDYSGTNRFEYVIGMQSISIFNVSYSQTSEMQTKTHAIDEGHSISKIELESDESLIDGTDIEYFVKVSGAEESDWTKIAPKNRENASATKEVNVGSSRKVEDTINISSGKIEKTYKGMNFYNIGSIPADRDVNIRSLGLYRGVNAWKLNFDKNIISRTAKDVYINFNYQSPDGRQKIYTYRSNRSKVISTGKILSDNTRPQAAVRVPHKIDYNNASMTLVPVETSEHYVYEPNYAVASVKRQVSGQSSGYSTESSEIRGDRMQFEPNGQDTYQTTPHLKVVADSISDVINNQIPNESFVQSETGSTKTIFSYTDEEYPEQIIVMRKTSSSGVIVANQKYEVLGTFPVTTSGSIEYGNSPEFIEENGHQILEVAAGTVPGFPSSAIIEDTGSFFDIFDGSSSNIYVLYASLSSNPVTKNASSVTNELMLIPNYQHSQTDPTMFSNLNFPISVHIETKDGTINDNFTATGKTKATISKTLSDGSNEIEFVDALIIDRNGSSSSIPPIDSTDIKTWYIMSSDITKYVEQIDDRVITFNAGLEFDINDEIIVNYRAQFGNKLKIREETVVLKPEPGSDIIYEQDKDYRIDPSEGTISMISSGSINRGNVGKAYLSMDYTEEFNDLYIFETWMHSSEDKHIDINRFGGYISENNSEADKSSHDIDINYNDGEQIIIDNQQIDKKSSIDISEGWHKIIIKTSDILRAKNIMSAVDNEQGYVFASGNYFDRMVAYKEPLRYLSPEVFYDANRLGKHKYFTIESDNSIIISFNPGDNAFTNNKLYKVFKGELTSGIFSGNLISDPENIPTIFEQFMLQYTYMPKVAGFASDVAIDANTFSSNGFLPAVKNRYVIDKVLLKAVLKRSNGQPANKTPVLRSYKLLIEG